MSNKPTHIQIYSHICRYIMNIVLNTKLDHRGWRMEMLLDPQYSVIYMFHFTNPFSDYKFIDCVHNKWAMLCQSYSILNEFSVSNIAKKRWSQFIYTIVPDVFHQIDLSPFRTTSLFCQFLELLKQPHLRNYEFVFFFAIPLNGHVRP